MGDAQRESAGYFQTRLAYNAKREVLWETLVRGDQAAEAGPVGVGAQEPAVGLLGEPVTHSGAR